MTHERAQFLIENGRNLPVSILSDLPEDENIVACWGDAGLKLVSYIESHKADFRPMKIKDFLTKCIAQGGNWGGMLLSGLNALYPAVYDLVPDDMGHFAWRCICDTLILCNVDCSDSGAE